MRGLPINRETLRPVLDQSLGELLAYLDTIDGSIIFVSYEARTKVHQIAMDLGALVATVDWITFDTELDDWERTELLNAVKTELDPITYLKIPTDSVEQIYDDMLEFAKSVPQAKIRQKLLSDIEEEWAYRRFQKTLSRHPAERERWFKFREKRRMNRFLDWLTEKDFFPEWT